MVATRAAVSRSTSFVRIRTVYMSSTKKKPPVVRPGVSDVYLCLSMVLRLRRAFASGLVGLRLLRLFLGLRGVASRSGGRVVSLLLFLRRLLFLLLGGRLVTTRLLGEDGHRERERDAERQCTDERVLHVQLSFSLQAVCLRCGFVALQRACH